MLLNKIQNILLFIISFRLISWFIVRTYFIADEYWQTFEIAHSLAFNYGYKTWEWKSDIAIRSYLYPFIISLIYRLLALFHLDNASILINCATLFQTFLAFLGDLAYLKFLQGHKLIYLILLCRYTCWYTFYSSPRLIVNNLEEILFIFSLASAKNFHSSSNLAFHLSVSLSFILRPTSAIPFVIIYPYLLYKISNRLKFILQAFLCFILLNILNISLDSYMYNRLTFVAWNFFHINFLHPNSISSHYGINNLFWYFTNGLPMIYFYRLPLIFLGILSNKRLSIIIFFTIFIYTLNIHKEFRFLTQILPILFILEANGIDWCLKKIQWKKQFQLFIYLSFIGHLLIGIYFSLIDRQGQIFIMNYLRTNLIEKPKQIYSIDFLMPCHSTPYYNFIHRNDIQLHFLTCEPNLNKLRNKTYIDEADQFYLKPIELFKQRINNYNTSHLIMFDILYEQMKDILEDEYGFFVKNILFNSHIQHTSRHGKMIYILEKQ